MYRSYPFATQCLSEILIGASQYSRPSERSGAERG